MAEEQDERSWKTVLIKPIRITGKWITGIEVQEGPGGKRRAKIFKGLIKENGSKTLEKDGKTYRFSMVQRFNVPSLEYWLRLNKEVVKIMGEYVEGKHGQKRIVEFEK